MNPYYLTRIADLDLFRLKTLALRKVATQSVPLYRWIDNLVVAETTRRSHNESQWLIEPASAPIEPMPVNFATLAHLSDQEVGQAIRPAAILAEVCDQPAELAEFARQLLMTLHCLAERRLRKTG